MEKVIKSNEYNILWLAYQQHQIFEKFNMNDNFINMVKEFKISKSTILFKISIIKFINKYPRMKKSSLSSDKQSLFNYSGKNHISTKSFFIYYSTFRVILDSLSRNCFKLIFYKYFYKKLIFT